MTTPFWTTKTVKGRKYLYLERRHRQGGKVRSTSAYIMPLELWQRACWLAVPSRKRKKTAGKVAEWTSGTGGIGAVMSVISTAYAVERHGRKQPYYDALRRMAAVKGETRRQLRDRMERGKIYAQQLKPKKTSNLDFLEGLPTWKRVQITREMRKAPRLETTRKTIRQLVECEQYEKAARLLRITGEAPEQYGFKQREV